MRKVDDDIIATLTKEEEMDLVRRAQAGDKPARDRVILSMYKLASREATSIARGGISEPEELLQIGMEACCTVLDRFDPDRGLRFNTYAAHRIRGAMMSAARKEYAAKLPQVGEELVLGLFGDRTDDSDLDEEELLVRVRAAIQTVLTPQERDTVLLRFGSNQPTQQEIADRLGCTRQNVALTLKHAVAKLRAAVDED